MFSKEYALSVVFVKGEISNCKYHSSGHIYFSLKDDRSQLTCVMFRGDRGGLDFRMENGQEVVVGGSISVYERDGKYQLYAKKIVPVGDGHLQEQYEKLKKKLEAAGYFDEDRKLPIPKYVKKVGIVTAKTGAAVHDSDCYKTQSLCAALFISGKSAGRRSGTIHCWGNFFFG